jgi:hypothetical protein
MRYLFKRRVIAAALEDHLWSRMPPVGREFGSPDFDRLMGEDHPDSIDARFIDPLPRALIDRFGDVQKQ